MTSAIEKDIWLSGVLSLTSYRLAAPPDIPHAETLLDQLDQDAAGEDAFAYVKIPADRVDLAERFTRHGFYIVDTSVTFNRAPGPVASGSQGASVTVRPAARDEYLRAREIAGSCIVYSRFHQDPRMGKAKGDAVNWSWIDSYCRGARGEGIHVALVDGQIVGFNAMLRSDAGGLPCRVIDLIGVESTAQGAGVGNALMEYFVEDTTHLQLSMQVTTQAANVPAVRLYERNGFRLAETFWVLHRYLGPEKQRSH